MGIFGEKIIHSTRYLKMKIVSTGIRTIALLLWVELSTTELFDLLMSGHKISVYQMMSLFAYQSTVGTYLKMTNIFEENAM